MSSIYTVENRVVIPLTEDSDLEMLLDELEQKTNDVLNCINKIRRLDVAVELSVKSTT